MHNEYDKLADALDAVAHEYRAIANNEMNDGCGSIDKVYDCVRNSRNLSNKSRKVRQFGALY